MPFVERIIEPKYLSRKSLFDENGRSLVSDYELEAVTNNTLTNVLRQLASLVLVANDIFEDLAKQLHNVYERSCKLKTTISSVEEKLLLCDPKTVTVPESDICTFSLRTIHYKSSHPFTTGLFTTSSRPNYLQKLYESAAPTPVHTIRQLDRFRRDGTRSSKFFVCTPVLAGRKKRYKKVDLDIETRKPMAVEDLRRWTSAEALGDITVLPDNTSKIPILETSEVKDEVDHLLPSPEEQMMAVALKFPPSIVAVDISGKPFDRMSGMRRSLMNMEVTGDGAPSKRRSKRRSREKRRNTIAGTSQKEIQQAIAGETTTETEGCEFEPLPPLRSKSTDLFKLAKTTLSPTDNIKNHFNTLKNWSKTKLRFMNRNSSFESCRPSFQGTDVVDDIGIYETVSSGSNKHKKEKERKPSSSSSAISIPVSTSSIATSLVVKLRENSLQRRHWRKGTNKAQDEPAHSSSGNWSASSESGRTSIASETTAPPKSSTTTSNNSLNHHHHHHPPPSVQSRRRYFNTSTSSSVSEGTLTPDINEMQYHDMLDGETSSVYSCDTEGYYTSFHMDSGLKTLKEEEIALSFSTLQLQEETGPSTTTFNNTSSSGSSSAKTNQLTAENEYELFGKGSTSTTTSSAGTVCTMLLAGNTYGSTRSLSQFAPAVPERKSSLERKTDKNKNKNTDVNTIQLISDDLSENNDELETTRVVALIHDSPSPDSGHNTSSSPAESASQNSQSPHEHLEFSESDLESCDRTERIRTKTAMTTCRIPSMCMITPPQSDDEVNLRNSTQVPYPVKCVPLNHSRTANQDEIVKNKQNVLNGKLLAQPNGGKPLHIQIPKVPDFKKEITDIYAYPDKSKKTKATNTVKTVSTNGVLETNLDSVADETKDPLHLIVNGETGYATIKTEIKKTHRSPSPSGGIMMVKDKEEIPKPSQPSLKPSLLPSNFMERFKEAINKQKKPEKRNDDGDYVMIVEKQKSPKTDLEHSAKEEPKTEYVSLNELPTSKNTLENPLALPNDSSLERKKRQGARVTLDSDGKVVFSSDSLKRKKQHSTFIPGKYVRESPTPSPLLDKRVSKPIRPVNCSGLIRTNSEDRQPEARALSPQMGKLIIKAGTRSCNSPTKDFVRMPPARVVTPTNTTKRLDKGARVVLENGQLKNRSSSPASSEASSLERRKRIDRCVSPSSSSSSSTDATATSKKLEIDLNTEEGTYPKTPRWISQHPAVSQNQQFYSQSGFPRNHPMYWTLPARNVYGEENRTREDNNSKHTYGKLLIQDSKTRSLKESFNNNTKSPSSSQPTGAMESSHGLSSLRLVQNVQRNEFTSSTPTKDPLHNSNSLNLGNGMSPILKENLFNTKSKMTAEEIFAAIHKSKKKLNIKDDLENRSESPSSSSLSPDGSESSLTNKLEKSRERSSWSPNSDFDLKSNEARTRKSWIGASTPINSFKKLLLQQGVKNPISKDFRISAVEQLKLSKQSNNLVGKPENNKTPPRTALNNKSRTHWRFASPRTDILSSTIPEDCSEVEKPEDALKYQREIERLSPRFVRPQGLDYENLYKGTDLHESKNEIPKPREKSSLEITKKYLQQARRNFFSESISPNTVGLPGSFFKDQLNSSSVGVGVDKPNNSIMTYKNFQSIKNSVSSNEKKKSPIISLETAL